MLAVLAAPLPAAAQEEFVPGTGNASAGVARVTLRSSGAAIGVGVGQARARYAGAQGNAEAAAVDAGLLETIGKAPIACGTAPGTFLPPNAIPERLIVSSGDGAAERRTAAAGAGSPIEIGPRHGSAAPNSAADATVGGVRLNLPGVITAVGGSAESSAQLTPGTQRSAVAGSEVSRLSLVGGLVELTGMRWTASERTGAVEGMDAGFSVSEVTVGGQRMPTTDAASLAEALGRANAALAPTGLALQPPKVVPTGTGTSVSPLRLSISATPAVRTAVAVPLAALQPVRTQLLEFFKPFGMGPDCSLATALGFSYLISDLALLALGEGGGVDLDIGGARAATDATAYADPFASGFGAIAPLGPDERPTPRGAVEGAAPARPEATAPARPVPRPADGTGTASAPVPRVPAQGAGDRAGRAPATVALAPTSALSCRSTHQDGDGCARRDGVLAGGLAVALIVLLAAADRLRARRARAAPPAG